MAAQSKTANKSAIDLQITTNGNNEITGADLNTILDNLVDSYEDFIGSYTTVQIAALVGMTTRQIVYDTTIKAYYYYDGTAWQPFNGRKYKVYTALLTQSGTDAPVATVLENTLGGTVVWTYAGVGDYVATLTGAFVSNKTYPIPPGNFLGANYGSLFSDTGNENELELIVFEHDTGNPANDGLIKSAVEIRVYY